MWFGKKKKVALPAPVLTQDAKDEWFKTIAKHVSTFDVNSSNLELVSEALNFGPTPTGDDQKKFDFWIQNAEKLLEMGANPHRPMEYTSLRNGIAFHAKNGSEIRYCLPHNADYDVRRSPSLHHLLGSAFYPHRENAVHTCLRDDTLPIILSLPQSHRFVNHRVEGHHPIEVLIQKMNTRTDLRNLKLLVQHPSVDVRLDTYILTIDQLLPQPNPTRHRLLLRAREIINKAQCTRQFLVFCMGRRPQRESPIAVLPSDIFPIIFEHLVGKDYQVPLVQDDIMDL
eukprot:c2539_g1_i1.p1 GENE.c2539_g1_i1~~c2539_g1_i1.p1  ORF type:complete len:305 (-),score=60.32 c2539_g1_i1:358-1209(-)